MANRIIGSIPYSLAAKVCNPNEETVEKKIFATAQSRETVTLRLLAQHMSEHNTSFSVGQIYGVLADMITCTTELLKAGYSVNLDGLARFNLGLSSTGIAKEEDWSTALIKEVRVRAAIDKDCASQFTPETLDFEMVPSRKQQAEARKAARAAVQAKVDENGNENENPNENGNGNGGNSGGEITE